MQHDKKVVKAFFTTFGLPAPEAEYKFADDVEYTDKRGVLRRRRWAFDFAWPEYLVAVEIEGGLFMRGGGRHNRGFGMLKDMEKYNTAAVKGWRVLRFTPDKLLKHATIVLVRQCFKPAGL